jgi:hypothetical protein
MLLPGGHTKSSKDKHGVECHNIKGVEYHSLRLASEDRLHMDTHLKRLGTLWPPSLSLFVMSRAS